MNRRFFVGACVAVACVQSVPAFADEPTRFTATVTGSGPDVVLIPGLASSAAVWGATVSQLSPTHRVHVLQVAGFAGATAGPNSGDAPMVAPLVSEVADYADRLDDPAIIGHSLGGLIAVEVAAARPEAVARIMVVDALPFYPLIFSPAATVGNAKPQAAVMRDQMLGQSDAEYAAGQPAVAAFLSRSKPAQADILEWSLASDRKVVAKAMYEVMTTDARPNLADIKADVTVVYAHDAAMNVPAAMVDSLYSSAYAALDGVALKRVDGSFHFVMLDQPEAFAEAVAAFLN